MKTLIVIDMQNDFVTGSLGTKEAQAIVPNVKDKISDYALRKDNVIFTRDTHEKDYLDTQEGKLLPVEHCIRDTEGWLIENDIEDDVNFLVLELDDFRPIVVDKNTFGYKNWKSFSNIFKDCEEIELIGVCSDICVISNALILKSQFPEIKIAVDASCCAGVTPELHEAALKVMRSCQINVIGDENND